MLHALHCWIILIFFYAYALNFINRCFWSLFWLLGVPIGSQFHKKFGPYIKAWRSLFVLGTVPSLHEGLRWCYSQERSMIIDIPINTVKKKTPSCTVATHVHGSPFGDMGTFFSFWVPIGTYFRSKVPIFSFSSLRRRNQVPIFVKWVSIAWGYCTYELLGDPFPLGTSFRFWVPLFSISKKQSNGSWFCYICPHLILIDCQKLHQWSS